ncbi:MAG: acetoacetate decarboxylase [Frankiales bacterium]|nr:acetoacetate decarboxylase [Frankiales bacterium]MCW2707789.1 acetoacetate decarboxylase [Frankiales bacterium]
MSDMTAAHDVLGQTVTMPVEVADASSGTVIFDVPLEAAQALAPEGFDVLETEPGRAQLAIALIDYRVNDLGAYHEVGTILFVRPTGGGDDGNFITHLPVDQEFTCAAGNQIWGFPKSVERIDVTQTDTTSRWVLTMGGELVLDVTVPRGGTDEMPPLPMTSYTLIDGKPHATRFTQGGSGSSIGFGEGVSVTLGTHPIAKELASLGLPDAKVVITTWTEKMQATFEDAHPL